MIYYQNDCVDCALPCIFSSCPHYNVLHSKCDYCKREDVKLHKYLGSEICEECLLNEFEVVEGTDDWI